MIVTLLDLLFLPKAALLNKKRILTAVCMKTETVMERKKL